MKRLGGICRTLVATIVVLSIGRFAWSAPPAKPGADKPSSNTPAKPIGTDVPQTTSKQMLAGSKLTFKCDNLPAADAVAQLEKLAGIKLVGDDDEIASKKTVTCDDHDQPLLTVIQHVCEQGGLSMKNAVGYDLPSLLLCKRDSKSLGYFPKRTDGSIEPVITSATTFGAKNEDKKVRLMMTLAVEPKVCLIGWYKNATILSGTDDQDKPLELLTVDRTNVRRRVFYPTSSNIHELDCGMFKYPAAPAKSVKRFSGSITVVLGLNVDSRDLSAALRPGKGAQLPFAKSAITFSDLRMATNGHNRYVVSMVVPHVRLPSGRDVEDSEEIAQLRFQAADADGRIWPVYPDRPSLIHFGEPLNYSLIMSPPAEQADEKFVKPPTKLQVLIPGKVEECVIPFEFNDIVLPKPTK